MHNAEELLTRIISLGQGITQVKDVDILLEKILTEARNIANADAGSIYVKKDTFLLFKHAQNDTKQQLLPQGKRLMYATFSLPLDNRSIAGYVGTTGITVNIPDAYAIDAALPFTFDKKFDALSSYRTQSILAFPLKTPQNQILGVLQLINAKDNENKTIAFSADDEPFIMHFANTAAIALERAQMTREIILRMLRMAEMRDPKETGAHVNRVGAYAAVIYEAWAAKKGVTQTEIDKTKDILRIAAMLHDVGKVAISDTILKKPARLDPEEIVCMKKHTNLGAQLFSDAQSELDSAAYYIALEHHERWDGQGYPGYSAFDDGPASERTGTDGDMHQPKRGQAIHLFGRIVAVADVYDALSSKRCYKESWDEDKVLENLQQESGRQFDPDIVDAFFNVLDQVHHIREQYPDAN